MGIDNRDYLREPVPGGGFGSSRPTGHGMVFRIVMATVVVFVLQLIIPGQKQIVALETADGRIVQRVIQTDGAVTHWLKMDFDEIAHRGQIWRLLTYAFCHDTSNILHIIFNLWILWILGREIEALYGSKEFIWFYLVSAVFAAVCYIALGFLFGDLAPMLGASGAVTAVTMLYTLHYPRRKIYLYGIIGVEMRWLMAFVIVMDLHPILLQAGQGVRAGNVAHAAHLGGALFGWVYFRRQIRLSSLIHGVGLGARRTRSAKRDLKIFTPPKPPVGGAPSIRPEDVDAILAKISEHGEASLTDQEREMLKQASQQYKHR